MMTSSAILLQHARPSRATWLLRALALGLSLTMLLYGLLVIDTGVVNFTGAGNADVVAKRVELIEAAEAGRPL